MSEQVNSLNIPSLQQKTVSFRQNPSQLQTQALAMQGTTTIPGVPQNVSDTQLGNRVKNSAEMGQSPYTVPLTAALWYGISQGMDKFNAKCNGTYEESILGKVTGKADKLSDTITGSNFYKSKPIQTLGNAYNAIVQYLDRVTNNPKNRILYALRNTPTKPECKMVKVPAAGLDGFKIADVRQVFEEFLKPIEQGAQLKQYGKDSTYINNFMESIKGLSKAEKLKRLQLEELQFFGVNSADIVGKSADEVAKLLKELKITKGLGFSSVEHYAKLTEESYALSHLNELTNTLKNGNQNLKVVIWKKDGTLGKVFGHLFGREVGLSEIVNKLSVTAKTGAKTKFGKAVGKGFGYLIEGCTNRYAGGKMAVLMQAAIFADMLIHTAKAPKGEKGKTLAERFVNDFSYFLALPIGIWAMHKVGGLKYLGMTKDQVEAYRKNLKFFNERYAVKGAVSKKGYKLRKKVLDRQLMAGVKNPFLKLLKKAGKILTVGIERIKPYASKDAANLNLLRKSKYWGKNIVGYPIRFLIPMMLISPFIAKWTTKATHAIFGRPTNSVLDEDKEEKETQISETAANSNVSEQNIPQVKTPEHATIQRNPNSYTSNTNLIKMTANGQKPELRSYIPSPESNFQQQPIEKKQEETEPVRTYIPSPQAAVIQQNTDMSNYSSAIAEADAAEKYAQSILKM
ncbi:hypothetical protein HDR58_07405 [bacterium]|nr:hypothetical protein [bacterium]